MLSAMKPSVQVRENVPGQFAVVVTEGRSQSSYLVSLNEDYYRTLTSGKVSTEALVEQSFYFLLEREPSQSILRKFDLSIISRYFPDYEAEIKKRLGQGPTPRTSHGS